MRTVNGSECGQASPSAPRSSVDRPRFLQPLFWQDVHVRQPGTLARGGPVTTVQGVPRRGKQPRLRSNDRNAPAQSRCGGWKTEGTSQIRVSPIFETENSE